MDQDRLKLDPGCLVQKSQKKYITNSRAGKVFYDTFYDNHWTVHLDADKMIYRGFSDMHN
jgi:hypothetical protein